MMIARTELESLGLDSADTERGIWTLHLTSGRRRKRLFKLQERLWSGARAAGNKVDILSNIIAH